MSLVLDFSQDYLATFDSPEAVTFTSHATAGDTTASVAKAIRESLDDSELEASNGAYVKFDVNWFLPGPLLGVLKPKPGDSVTDTSSVVWTVLSASYESLDQIWELTCRDPIIVYALQDVITIQTPVLSKDATGAIVRTWGTRYAALAARVQPIQDDPMEERLVKATARRVSIYVAQQVNVTNDAGFDRVLFNGKYYDITSYQNAERIGELPLIEATLKS